jgi:hypothetical protein
MVNLKINVCTSKISFKNGLETHELDVPSFLGWQKHITIYFYGGHNGNYLFLSSLGFYNSNAFKKFKKYKLKM